MDKQRRYKLYNFYISKRKGGEKEYLSGRYNTRDAEEAKVR